MIIISLYLQGIILRFLRILNIFVILFDNTRCICFSQKGISRLMRRSRFFITEEEFAISIFWQFILLELAVDGLKLASLNTPDSPGHVAVGDRGVDTG